DAAAACLANLAHGIEHAGIVAAIGARLYEDETRDAEMPGQRQIVHERRERRRIAQFFVHSADRIARRRPEHMEVRIAGERRRAESWRSFIHVVQRHRSGDYWIEMLARATMSRQTAISRAICSVISAGVEVTATAACLAKASRSRGCAQARTT